MQRCEAKVRIVLHVDMDSFFSAIEVREHPELRGLPVIVGGRIRPNEGAPEEYKRGLRGVVSTCSYEARAYGIHSAMPLVRAYQLCPDARFLPVNMPLYKRVSAEIMRILRRYAERFEQVGIDEAYLDISRRVHGWEEARAYAERIKQEIREKEGLTCSIGIGPNKLIAKIASGFVKPDGLTLVEEEEVREFLAPLPVKKIPGVGPKTEKRLNQMGIQTIEELSRSDVQNLIAAFGKYGRWLYLAARGIDACEVEEREERKSLSRERTLDEHTTDLDVINRYIAELAEEVHERLVAEGLVFKTIGIKVKFEDFSLRTRARTLPSYHADLATLRKTAKELMTEFLARRWPGKEKKVRLVGVRVSQFRLIDENQRRLV